VKNKEILLVEFFFSFDQTFLFFLSVSFDQTFLFKRKVWKE